MLMIKSDVRINYCKVCLTGKLFLVNSFEDNRLLNKKLELVKRLE